MKIVQFDGVGGASGDMILGALADLGVDMKKVEEAVQTLDVEPIRFEITPASSHGLHGTRVHVHTSEDHSHHEGHGHGPEGHHHHPHRGLQEIKALIEASKLPASVQTRAIEIFSRIAEAEAQVHQQSVESVHFHEVGALDSIADIVGACYALELLAVDEVAVGPLPVGRGTVVCDHGEYPVPAPATVRLLEGSAVVQTDIPYELVTPTGAALLTGWKTCDAPPPGSLLAQAGYGFGQRQLEQRPNTLRALLFHGPAETGEDQCIVLECNLDDCTPELVGLITDRLLKAGALDVFTSPVFMKKQRPGVLLTVLAHPDDREAALDLIFRESTTFGVREFFTSRTVLPRETRNVSTPFGDVRVKVGHWKGEAVTAMPEIDDCDRLAQQNGVPVREVYAAAQAAARKQ